MALSEELVCSDCRRFWHGPPGRLGLSGPYCPNTRHQKPAPMVPEQSASVDAIHGWHLLADEVWNVARKVAGERDGQKSGFASSRYWNPESHFVGLLGEFLYGELSGEAVDITLRVGGDGGKDFAGGVDVKTTLYYRDPYLKHLVGARRWPRYFALVAVDLDSRRGRYCGFISSERLRELPTDDFGYGLRHVAREPDLDSGFPPRGEE